MSSLLALLISCGLVTAEAPERQSVILVVGAAGTEQYETEFAAWCDTWSEACRRAEADCTQIGRERESSTADFETLRRVLGDQDVDVKEPLWIVLIGHGTFDGRQAKFNLRGPDMTASQMAEWLTPFQRTVVVINCASASSPFLNRLAGDNRLVITATKSGYQYNFARFGKYLAQAIDDRSADLDKDGQTSLLEAFLLASAGVAEFYELEARLPTENALLDDNGDGLGTPADWFRGVRAVQKPKNNAAADGLRANQLHLVRSDRERRMPPEMRARRDQLESEIARLREQKSQLDEDDYYRQIETLFLELARLYASLDLPDVPPPQ